MPTQDAATNAVPKMVRLALTDEEWRALRVMAAEHDTSMQALVAQTMRRELATRIRKKAAAKAIAGEPMRVLAPPTSKRGRWK